MIRLIYRLTGWGLSKYMIILDIGWPDPILRKVKVAKDGKCGLIILFFILSKR